MFCRVDGSEKSYGSVMFCRVDGSEKSNGSVMFCRVDGVSDGSKGPRPPGYKSSPRSSPQQLAKEARQVVSSVRTLIEDERKSHTLNTSLLYSYLSFTFNNSSGTLKITVFF